MKKRCVKRSATRKESTAITLMALKAYDVKGKIHVGVFVRTQSGTIGDVIAMLKIEQLKDLLSLLHKITSVAVEDLSKRTGNAT